MMPMITMRTYAEEKRSGTIELLLTSPLTDLEIIVGKFIGAMGLYAAMLLVTMVYIAHPVHLRQPGVAPDSRRLPRTAADGRVVHLARALHLERHEESDRRRVPHLRHVPPVVGDRVVRRQRGSPLTQNIVKGLSITEHFSDFARGIVDSYHVVYYLSFITFGLFLTAKSVDMERWRG